MTTVQRSFTTAAIVVAVATAIYEAQQASALRSEIRARKAQQALLTSQIEQLKIERDDAARQWMAARSDSQPLHAESSELLRLRGEVGLLRRQIAATKATQEATTNQIQFTNPYLRREEWSDKGTDKPLDTILTMFWAIRQGDRTKLEQIVSRANPSQQLDDLTLSAQVWDRLTGVQVVKAAWTRGTGVGGQMEDVASVETIIEKAPRTEGESKDVEVHSWTLKKTNDQWLITVGH